MHFIKDGKRNLLFSMQKKQQAMGILSNLGIKTPLSKVPLLNILF